MRCKYLILIALVCIPVAAGHAQAPTGSVVGTVFLRLQNGETQRGSALTVKLLDPRKADSEEFRAHCHAEMAHARVVDSIVVAMMDKAQEVGADIMPAARAGAEERVREFNRRSEVLAWRTVTTSVDGTYRFDEVPPSQYVVAAIWKLGRESTVWAVPITVGANQVTVDLHNGNPVELPRKVLACGDT